MGSSKKATVGYRYYMGLHFGICHGPVDTVQDVIVGERTAWTGAQAASGPIAIAAGELFGGDKREGGVEGVLDVMMGEPAQPANSYLVSKLGAVIPAFRGILSAVWRGGQVASNNPYVKPWAFRVKRIVAGWAGGYAWLPDKAPIVFVTPAGENASVKLLTRFEGASSADISQYVLGPGSLVEPTGVAIFDGYARFGVTIGPGPSSLSGLAWGSDELCSTAAVNPEMTWEYIFSVTQAAYTGYCTIAIMDIGWHASYKDKQVRISVNGGTAGTPPAGRLVVDSEIDGSTYWESPSSVLTNDGVVDFHIAVQKRADGAIQIYFNGSRVGDFGDYTGFAPGGGSGSGAVTLCNYPYNANMDVRCKAVRASTNLVYSGATYTVPTPTELTADFSSISPGIIGMNPAHIVYQCLTDTDWGMGYPTSAIDSASFTAAANALHAEGFGLSLLWNRQDAIESFIAMVLDHIGAMLYVKPDSSKFALKLIRADYVRASLPIYSAATLVSAENYQRQAWGETVNEITVVYTDHATGKDTSVTVQDAANIMTQGGVVSQTRSYPGIPWAPLAHRVAQRDLNAASTPLARIKLTATRAAWAAFPGDVFRLSWPEYGIDDVVYRALNVNYGTLQDGQIIIDAVEDVFGLPDNTYLVDQPGEWEDPSSAPAAAPYRLLLETPYWDLVRNLSAADMSFVDSLSGYLETLAVRPSSDATNYSLYARTGSADYTQRGNGDFCPTATVVSALTKTTTAITLANGIDLDIVAAGGYAVIDAEYVLVEAIDWLAGTATIARGVLDTVPVAHAAGASIWFADGYQGFDTTEFADAETVDVKLRPITGRGELPLASAPVDSLTFDQRQYRPYPPAKIRFDSLEWPAIIEGYADVVLTWAHRDRTLQTAYIVTQSEASIGPEVGVTYSLEVADEALTVLHSETGITAATATVTASALTPGLLRFRLWSVRGGLASMQRHEHWAAWGDVRATESGEDRITESGESRIVD